MLTFQPIMRVALYMLGIAVQPRTGVLCAAVDERDGPGDNRRVTPCS
jgi:hypothetical protein